MKHLTIFECFGFFLISALVGCSTPETRSKEIPAVFAQLPAATQQAVLKGRIDKGISGDAVYIALGAPDRKRVTRQGKVDEERWIYFRTEIDQIPHYTYDYVQGKNGRVYSIPRYDPIEVRRREPDFEVTFLNGKVSEWGRL